MSRPQFPFWVLTIALITALSIAVLVQKGMFMDGVLYTCVARNQALGIGTFWFPQYSSLNIAGIPSFYEQPPLVFGIQSVFFRIFGDHLYVERLYIFLMLCLNAWMIVRIWKTLPFSESIRKVSWLPVVCWISVPVCFWSYANNMQENTMSLFVLGAIYMGYLAHAKDRHRNLNLLLSGLFVFLASFSKGLPGFYPLVLPFAWWLAFERKRLGRAFRNSLVMMSVPAVIYAVLFSLPVSGESLRIYLFERALNRISTMPTAAYRLEIIWRTFTELLPPLILIAGIYTIGRMKGIKLPVAVRTHALFFLLLGMAGSFPLALTMVQAGFYLVPSFPGYGIALALMGAPAVAQWTGRLAQHPKVLSLWRSGSIAALAGALAMMIWSWGRYYRHQDIIEDVSSIGKVVPAGVTLGLPVAEYDEYDFIFPGYLMRYNRQSLDPYKQYEYFVALKEEGQNQPVGYEPVRLPLHRYVLYQKTAKREQTDRTNQDRSTDSFEKK